MSIPITPEQDTSAMAVMSVSEPIKGKKELSINLICGFEGTICVIYSDGTLCGGVLNSPIEHDDAKHKPLRILSMRGHRTRRVGPIEEEGFVGKREISYHHYFGSSSMTNS
jgi:hypothetical protein